MYRYLHSYYKYLVKHSNAGVVIGGKIESTFCRNRCYADKPDYRVLEIKLVREDMTAEASMVFWYTWYYYKTIALFILTLT